MTDLRWDLLDSMDYQYAGGNLRKCLHQLILQMQLCPDIQILKRLIQQEKIRPRGQTVQKKYSSALAGAQRGDGGIGPQGGRKLGLDHLRGSQNLFGGWGNVAR